jgi:hypothetical protein
MHILAENGYYALNMRDIASLGILDQEGQRRTMSECKPWSENPIRDGEKQKLRNLPQSKRKGPPTMGDGT